MIAKDISKLAYLYLNDQTKSRWTELDMMIPFIKIAIDQVVALRSDAMIDANGAVRTITKPTAITDTINLDDKFIEPMAEFVASRCYAMQAGSQFNAEREKTHMTNFIQMVMNV